jgi:hypothetical protein
LQLALTVSPDVSKKQITERDSCYSLCQRLIADQLHGRFIFSVATWPGYRRSDQREPGSLGLHFYQRTPRAVHGHAIKSRVNGRHQPGDLILSLLTQHVQRPRAVFSATPCQQDFLLHWQL